MEISTEQWSVPGYRELYELGRGAQGRVVLAGPPDGGAEVAIKYLEPGLLSDARSVAAFRREAETLALIIHPNVARVLRYEQCASGAAIVMEAVHGPSLREILDAHGAMPPESALAVLRGSLLGLAAAHQAGVVHGDYKPANLIVQPDGGSKLIDFGIAVLAGHTLRSGTPSYMAPEQWQGHPASAATDIYSATCVLYECLAGTKPYPGDGLKEVRGRHLSDPVPVHAVPEPIHTLLHRGMAKDPAQRFSDASWFVAELETVAEIAYGPGWWQRGLHALAKVAAGLTAALPLAMIGSFGDVVEAAGNLTGAVEDGGAAAAGASQPASPAHPGQPGGVQPDAPPHGGVQPDVAPQGGAQPSGVEQYFNPPHPGTGDMAGKTATGGKAVKAAGGGKAAKAAGGGKAVKTAAIAVTAVAGAGALVAVASQLRDDTDSKVRPQAVPTRKLEVGGTATGVLKGGFRKPGPMVSGSRGPSAEYHQTVKPARVTAGTKVTVKLTANVVRVPGDYAWTFGSDRWDIFLYPSPPAQPGRIPSGKGVNVRIGKKEVISPKRRVPLGGGASQSTGTTLYTFSVPPRRELPPGRYLLTVMTPPRFTKTEADDKPIPPSSVGAYSTGTLPVVTVLPGPGA